jgi:hypothetical protein
MLAQLPSWLAGRTTISYVRLHAGAALVLHAPASNHAPTATAAVAAMLSQVQRPSRYGALGRDDEHALQPLEAFEPGPPGAPGAEIKTNGTRSGRS